MDKDIVSVDEDMDNEGIDVNEDVDNGTSSINNGDPANLDGNAADGTNSINNDDAVIDETDNDIIYQIANNEISSLNNTNKTDDLAITVYNGNDGLVTEKQHERIPTVYVVSKSNIAIDNIKKTVNSEHYIFLGVSDNSEEALYFIEENTPDIVFLSLDIYGKLNGEELGKLINKLDIPIIYIFNLDDDLSYSSFIETNYGFVFEDYSPEEIKFVIKVALKKHESNVKSVINVKSKMTEKNVELGIEKLYSTLLLVLSVILIADGIISRNVTFLQWIIFIPSVMMIFLAIVSLFKMTEPTPYDIPPFVFHYYSGT